MVALQELCMSDIFVALGSLGGPWVRLGRPAKDWLAFGCLRPRLGSLLAATRLAFGRSWTASKSSRVLLRLVVDALRNLLAGLGRVLDAFGLPETPQTSIWEGPGSILKPQKSILEVPGAPRSSLQSLTGLGGMREA